MSENDEPTYELTPAALEWLAQMDAQESVMQARIDEAIAQDDPAMLDRVLTFYA